MVGSSVGPWAVAGWLLVLLWCLVSVSCRGRGSAVARRAQLPLLNNVFLLFDLFAKVMTHTKLYIFVS